MRCPACRKTLVVVEHESIELDWCLDCRGLWFDEGELELLAEKSGRRLEPRDVGRLAGASSGPHRRRCPRCRRRMQQVTVGGADRVRVDRCSDHGIWVDSGELGRILEQLDTVRQAGDLTDEAVIVRFLGETFGGPAPPGDRA